MVWGCSSSSIGGGDDDIVSLLVVEAPCPAEKTKGKTSDIFISVLVNPDEVRERKKIWCTEKSLCWAWCRCSA